MYTRDEIGESGGIALAKYQMKVIDKNLFHALFSDESFEEASKRHEELRSVNIKLDDTYTSEEVNIDESIIGSRWGIDGMIIMSRTNELTRVYYHYNDGLWHEGRPYPE